MKQPLKFPCKFWDNLLGCKWTDLLKSYLSSEEGQLFMSTLSEYYKTKEMRPFKKEVFNIFKKISPSDIKVVIIGEEPMDNGCGIPFANISPGENNNLELRKIFESMMYPIPYTSQVPPQDYTLMTWIVQGVFMMNMCTKSIENEQTILHRNLWEGFIRALLTALNNLPNTIFFIFIGNSKSFDSLISSHNHIIINLPSPKECLKDNTLWDVSHFYKINLYLQLHCKKLIKWIELS